MSAVTFQQTHEFIVEHCYKCGVAFAFSRQFQRRAMESKESFFCPNGHSQYYTENEADRLRKELEAVKRSRDWHQVDSQRMRDERDTVERKLRATKGVVTRTKNRISKGVCPCCNRQFKDLHSHMTTKHPNYATAE